MALGWRRGPGDQEESIRILDGLITETADHPSYPYWLYFRSLTHEGLENYQDAANDAARSVQIQPLFFLARLVNVNALAVLGSVDEANSELEWIRENQPHVSLEAYVDELRVHEQHLADSVEQHVKGLKALGALQVD